ncbi:tau-tubulin kinase [Anaeramoeba flamelloides]|uniref:non-specific serine/threonine protein kinase n=1 Tax=Anaeramoeba flamelloides TaxID=1746091 RepID=A0AAV7Z409_9EUKA|nr:tau-tubulin kinase [Anaeramoeba flamelloides]
MFVGQIILEKWQVKQQIGHGGFGQIYLSEDLETGQEIAIKFEKIKKKQSLRLEALVLNKMQNSIYSPHLFRFGRHNDYYYLSMELLGLNLADLRRCVPKNRFSLQTTLMLSIDMITAIQEIHKIGFVHRDIKPSNFVMSFAKRVNKEHTTYYSRCCIIDYGLSRKYLQSNGIIREPRGTAGFRGTARYASINSHKLKELGRVDDLRSLFYLIVEFMTGYLPWAKMKDKDKIFKEKLTNSFIHLLKYLPKEFQLFYDHLQDLTYKDEPNYNYLRSLMKKALKRAGYVRGLRYDWEIFFNDLKKNLKYKKFFKSIIEKNNNNINDDDPNKKLLKFIEVPTFKQMRKISKRNKKLIFQPIEIKLPNFNKPIEKKLLNRKNIQRIRSQSFNMPKNPYTKKYKPDLKNLEISNELENNQLLNKDSQVFTPIDNRDEISSKSISHEEVSIDEIIGDEFGGINEDDDDEEEEGEGEGEEGEEDDDDDDEDEDEEDEDEDEDEEEDEEEENNSFGKNEKNEILDNHNNNNNNNNNAFEKVVELPLINEEFINVLTGLPYDNYSKVISKQKNINDSKILSISDSKNKDNAEIPISKNTDDEWWKEEQINVLDQEFIDVLLQTKIESQSKEFELNSYYKKTNGNGNGNNYNKRKEQEEQDKEEEEGVEQDEEQVYAEGEEYEQEKEEEEENLIKKNINYKQNNVQEKIKTKSQYLEEEDEDEEDEDDDDDNEDDENEEEEEEDLLDKNNKQKLNQKQIQTRQKIKKKITIHNKKTEINQQQKPVMLRKKTKIQTQKNIPIIKKKKLTNNKQNKKIHLNKNSKTNKNSNQPILNTKRKIILNNKKKILNNPNRKKKIIKNNVNNKIINKRKNSRSRTKQTPSYKYRSKSISTHRINRAVASKNPTKVIKPKLISNRSRSNEIKRKNQNKSTAKITPIIRKKKVRNLLINNQKKILISKGSNQNKKIIKKNELKRNIPKKKLLSKNHPKLIPKNQKIQSNLIPKKKNSTKILKKNINQKKKISSTNPNTKPKGKINRKPKPRTNINKMHNGKMAHTVKNNLSDSNKLKKKSSIKIDN